MTAAVTSQRWLDAQAAEQRYWSGVPVQTGEFLRVLAEKAQVAEWTARQLGPSLPRGDVTETGIGPLGVGCAHFLRGDPQRTIVGVEPLPLVDAATLRIPEPLHAVVLACRHERYRHVRATGEETGLPSEHFELAFCYNVLDHVRDPGALLRETHRILRPGGRLVVGCDVVSLLSQVRFALWVRHRHRDEIAVQAHTFRFRAAALLRLVEDAGFRIETQERVRAERLHDLVGHARRVLLIGAK